MIKELWLPISGYEGLYEVSNLGRVRNFRGKIMKQTIRGEHKRVELRKDMVRKSKTVHILVCESFLSNTDNKPFVKHKDDDKSNNQVDNLEWCTEYDRNRLKLTDKEVSLIRDIYIPRDSEFGAKALAEKFRVHKGYISMIIRGKTR